MKRLILLGLVLVAIMAVVPSMSAAPTGNLTFTELRSLAGEADPTVNIQPASPYSHIPGRWDHDWTPITKGTIPDNAVITNAHFLYPELVTSGYNQFTLNQRSIISVSICDVGGLFDCPSRSGARGRI